MPRPKKKRTPDESGMETTVVTASFQDLARVLAGDGAVSGSGTREQIEYIDLDDVQPDPRNFYELSDIDELAANIELFGLQQPLRVRDDPLDPDKVILVSGHRRREAIARLVAEGRDDLRVVPCIREREAGSEALQELRLIYANSDTRRMTSAEVSKQAERVEALLYQLKDEGYVFPGRMRDHVAEACKVSKSKIARLKVIRERLIPELLAAWHDGKLNEDQAYNLAQCDRKTQGYILDFAPQPMANWYGWRLPTWAKYVETVRNLDCPQSDGEACAEQRGHIERSLSGDIGFTCDRCCAVCWRLPDCAHACALCAGLADEKRAQREAERAVRAAAVAQRRETAREKEARDIADLTRLWTRAGELWRRSGVSERELFAAFNPRVDPGDADLDELSALATGETKITGETPIPILPHSLVIEDIRDLISTGDFFGVSLDYLLGRTDVNRWPPEGKV